MMSAKTAFSLRSFSATLPMRTAPAVWELEGPTMTGPRMSNMFTEGYDILFTASCYCKNQNKKGLTPHCVSPRHIVHTRCGVNHTPSLCHCLAERKETMYFTGRFFLAGTMPSSLQVGLFLIKKRDYAVSLSLRPRYARSSSASESDRFPKMLSTNEKYTSFFAR